MVEPPSPVPRGSTAAVVPSALVFLAGVWLAAAPLLLEYRDSAAGPAAYLNEILVGTALMVASGVRVVLPVVTARLSIVNALLGVWLVASPFALGYDAGARVTTNNMVVGVAVALLAATSWFIARFVAGNGDGEL